MIKATALIVFLFPFYLLAQQNVIDMSNAQHYDSAQFHISRYYLASGKLSSQTYTDTIKSIIHEKNYDEAGRLVAEWDMDVERHFHTGTWKYYPKHGKPKTINFDSTNQVSYYKAMQLAKSYGYFGSNIEITEVLLKNKYYWQVINWKENTTGPQIGAYILIKRSGGKIITPKKNELQRFD